MKQKALLLRRAKKLGLMVNAGMSTAVLDEMVALATGGRVDMRRRENRPKDNLTASQFAKFGTRYYPAFSNGTT